jgi:NADH-quinone oxidoreductase subunit J
VARIVFGVAVAACVVVLPIAGAVAGFPAIQVLFGVIASLAIVLALGTVLARNLVHAALFLVGFFFLVACQFVLLEAEFMAAMQVLVYIGAVAILLMFGIMLTRNIQGDETTGGHWSRSIPAAIAGLALLAVLVIGIARESGRPVTRMGVMVPERPLSRPWGVTTERPSIDEKRLANLRHEAALESDAAAKRANPNHPVEPGRAQIDYEHALARSRAINNMGRWIGNDLVNRFAVPFEVAGLLLTAALIGAVALAQGEPDEDRPSGAAGRRADRAGADGSPPAGPTTDTLPTASTTR